MRTGAILLPKSTNDASKEALVAFVGAGLFALRLWASVCLALYLAFWLQLDNPAWAGASAAIASQTALGASLRKGQFRLIGTVVGAVAIVLMIALTVQSRFAFFGLLALWVGCCAAAATVLRNFASYAAALAGLTTVLIGVDTLGATGGATPSVFLLAVWRSTEICIGITSATIIAVATTPGSARLALSTSLGTLARDVLDCFIVSAIALMLLLEPAP